MSDIHASLMPLGRLRGPGAGRSRFGATELLRDHSGRIVAWQPREHCPLAPEVVILCVGTLSGFGWMELPLVSRGAHRKAAADKLAICSCRNAWTKPQPGGASLRHSKATDGLESSRSGRGIVYRAARVRGHSQRWRECDALIRCEALAPEQRVPAPRRPGDRVVKVSRRCVSQRDGPACWPAGWSGKGADRGRETRIGRPVGPKSGLAAGGTEVDQLRGRRSAPCWLCAAPMECLLSQMARLVALPSIEGRLRVSGAVLLLFRRPTRRTAMFESRLRRAAAGVRPG